MRAVGNGACARHCWGSVAVVTKQKTERLMNLVIALLVARHYVTKSTLRRTVEDYRDSSAEAFEKMFERDKDELRELGIPIEMGAVVSGFDDEVGYRIKRSEFELPEIAVSAEEAAVLGLAARVWEQARMAEATSQAMLKLAAGGVEVDRGPLEELTARLPAGEPAFEPLLDALTRRRVVRFDYRRSPGEDPQRRTLEPWGVLFVKGRWYVVGHDRDRSATRVFRMSRIVGDVKPEGRAGGYEVPDVDVAAEARSLMPDEPTRVARLRVRAGAGYGLRRLAESGAGTGGDASDDAVGVAPVAGDRSGDGWEEIAVPFAHADGLADDVLSYGEDVVVLEPPDLRELVVGRLTRLAGEPEPAGSARGPAGSR